MMRNLLVFVLAILAVVGSLACVYLLGAVNHEQRRVAHLSARCDSLELVASNGSAKLRAAHLDSVITVPRPFCYSSRQVQHNWDRADTLDTGTLYRRVAELSERVSRLEAR